MTNRNFPSTRLRRLRKNLNIIDLVSETNLTTKDLIQPIFIKENFNDAEPINSMPDIYRYGIEKALFEIEDVLKNNIKALALFPVIEDINKDDKGRWVAKHKIDIGPNHYSQHGINNNSGESWAEYYLRVE